MTHNRTLYHSLSSILQATRKSHNLSLEKLFFLLKGKHPFIIISLFTLPVCLPIQIPGIATPFGLIISYIAFGLMIGKKLWVPKKALQYRMRSQRVQKITTKALAVFKKMQYFLHPRLPILTTSEAAQKLSGLFIFIQGLFLSLPLPIPTTNVLPAFSILLISLGSLEKDGFIVLLGYGLAALYLIALSYLVLWGSNLFFS